MSLSIAIQIFELIGDIYLIGDDNKTWLENSVQIHPMDSPFYWPHHAGTDILFPYGVNTNTRKHLMFMLLCAFGL